MNDCTPIDGDVLATKGLFGNNKSLGIVACGALAREIEEIAKLNRLQNIKIQYLPAKLHNSPNLIPQEVEKALEKLAKKCGKLFVAYGDCGTAGALDVIIEKFDATRLKGSHCYAFFAGVNDFEKLHDAEPGTFYLTDYLARQFDNLVYRPLGLDRHPQLLNEYFGNYTRLLYLSQSDDEKLDAKARDAAKRLNLRFEKIYTGFGSLQSTIEEFAIRDQTDFAQTGLTKEVKLK
ncbi:hypothetical protein MNBD_ALPHA11-2091 [hydrothermal vent metagenome]|uniref:DUF1638 domain-containing protein n=1 Tax=hydrothermal vent metagenome TaxID=652676 RepID=A0A3B0US09_9ZZZZ